MWETSLIRVLSVQSGEDGFFPLLRFFTRKDYKNGAIRSNPATLKGAKGNILNPAFQIAGFLPPFAAAVHPHIKH